VLPKSSGKHTHTQGKVTFLTILIFFSSRLCLCVFIRLLPYFCLLCSLLSTFLYFIVLLFLAFILPYLFRLYSLLISL
jgi:hypothetical protein